jgi:hypothetical protein
VTELPINAPANISALPYGHQQRLVDARGLSLDFSLVNYAKYIENVRMQPVTGQFLR